jgi:hypothetical protein
VLFVCVSSFLYNCHEVLFNYVRLNILYAVRFVYLASCSPYHFIRFHISYIIEGTPLMAEEIII